MISPPTPCHPERSEGSAVGGLFDESQDRHEPYTISVATCRAHFLLSALLLFLVSTIGISASAIDKTADFRKRCGVDSSAVRFFANANERGWKKYSSAKDFPRPDAEWAEYASVWSRTGSPLLALLDGQGQDFSDSAYYCYSATGELQSVEHEFRTVWGWGYWESESLLKGLVQSRHDHFFETNRQSIIPRPSGADDVGDAMRLALYETSSKLPFFSLM